MIGFGATYRWRDNWKHTVEITEPEWIATDFGTRSGHDKFEEVIVWADKNAQARRISYDTWQFKSKQEAEQFIMLYALTWGS